MSSDIDVKVLRYRWTEGQPVFVGLARLLNDLLR